MIFFRRKKPEPPKEEKPKEKKAPSIPREPRVLTAEGWKRLNLKKIQKSK